MKAASGIVRKILSVGDFGSVVQNMADSDRLGRDRRRANVFLANRGANSGHGDCLVAAGYKSSVGYDTAVDSSRKGDDARLQFSNRVDQTMVRLQWGCRFEGLGHNCNFIRCERTGDAGSMWTSRSATRQKSLIGTSLS
jgi:hypothetical protein